ncbi:molecular chaperone DjiA [Rhodobacteraceae bacterium RKSG542]|uniref:molecular chaperone DjiA n=1 Tax=Pseudovibrio flavus TaxID=2529854 RepID=UPI0012BBD377|nr:molecular chaperone DjiA [Pseudovibrio flavus]MTI19130.1 molecular chaperone DjiA [Pseudovibrio flavus]
MNFWQNLSSFVSALQQSGAQLLDRIQSLLTAAQENRRSLAFTVAMIALSAKMAKADGVVTAEEVLAFENLFDIPAGEERNVARLFSLAQQDVAGFEAYAERINSLFLEDEETRIDILDALFFIAKADGFFHEGEDAYLERVAQIFGIDGRCYAKIKARHIRGGSDPYVVLDVSPDASYAEIRKRYLQEVKDTHPDQLIARGVPEEFVKIANDRLAAINSAFEQIQLERGL